MHAHDLKLLPVCVVQFILYLIHINIKTPRRFFAEVQKLNFGHIMFMLIPLTPSILQVISHIVLSIKSAAVYLLVSCQVSTRWQWFHKDFSSSRTKGQTLEKILILAQLRIQIRVNVIFHYTEEPILLHELHECPVN